MRVKVAYNLPLVQRLRIDLNRTLGKNSLKKLVRPTQKLTK